MCDSYAALKFPCVEVVNDQETNLLYAWSARTAGACFRSKVSANNLGSQCDSG